MNNALQEQQNCICSTHTHTADTIDNLMELNALSVLAISLSLTCECSNNNEIINQLIAGLSITTSSMVDTRDSMNR